RGGSGRLLLNPIFAHLFDQRRALEGQQTRGLRDDTIGKVQRDVDLLELDRFDFALEVDGTPGRGRLCNSVQRQLVIAVLRWCNWPGRGGIEEQRDIVRAEIFAPMKHT